MVRFPSPRAARAAVDGPCRRFRLRRRAGSVAEVCSARHTAKASDTNQPPELPVPQSPDPAADGPAVGGGYRACRIPDARAAKAADEEVEAAAPAADRPAVGQRS